MLQKVVVAPTFCKTKLNKCCGGSACATNCVHLQRYTVALQIAGKCCPYCLALICIIQKLEVVLRQKSLIFSSDFEIMFTKHSPSEILSLNFERKTVNLNCNFSAIITPARKDTMTSFTQENAVCEHNIVIMPNMKVLKAQNSRATY